MPSSLLLFLSEKDDVSVQTETAVCRLTATCAAESARVRISGPARPRLPSPPASPAWFPAAGGSLTDSAGGARISFSLLTGGSGQSRCALTCHLQLVSACGLIGKSDIISPQIKCSEARGSSSESRHRHIVIKSAAGLFCSNPSVHHSHLPSEHPRDKVLGNASISRTGKSDALFIRTAITLSLNCLERKKDC